MWWLSLLACSDPGAASAAERVPASLVSPDAVGADGGTEVIALGDMDGDGYGDLAMGHGSTLYEGEVNVVRGGPSGPEFTTPWTLTDLSGGDYARALGGGDFDGDGFADLAIQRYHLRAEVITDIHYGGAAGPNATADTTIDDNAGNVEQHGDLPAVDLDADGFDDLVLLRSDGTAVDVYPGSAAGVATSPITGFSLPEAATHVLPIDLDGDSRMDLVVSSRRSSGDETREGVVWAFTNTGAGFDPTPAWTYRRSGEPYAECGSALAAGDIDGDGLPEVLVGCPGVNAAESGAGAVDIFDAENLAAGPATTLAGLVSYEAFGASLGVGDLDGDGDADLVVGGWSLSGQHGTLSLYWNAGGGLVPGDRADVDDHAEGAGQAIAVGDQTGDGIADLAAATGEGASWGFGGRLWWWAGGPDGLALAADPPDWRLWFDGGPGYLSTGDFDGRGRP